MVEKLCSEQSIPFKIRLREITQKLSKREINVLHATHHRATWNQNISKDINGMEGKMFFFSKIHSREIAKNEAKKNSHSYMRYTVKGQTFF